MNSEPAGVIRRPQRSRVIVGLPVLTLARLSEAASASLVALRPAACRVRLSRCLAGRGCLAESRSGCAIAVSASGWSRLLGLALAGAARTSRAARSRRPRPWPWARAGAALERAGLRPRAAARAGVERTPERAGARARRGDGARRRPGAARPAAARGGRRARDDGGRSVEQRVAASSAWTCAATAAGRRSSTAIACVPGRRSGRVAVIGTPEAATPTRARRERAARPRASKSAQLVARAEPEAGGDATARARELGAARLSRASCPPGQEERWCGRWCWATGPGSTTETAEAFRVSGTYHVLALSGAQVALVAGLLIVAAARRRGLRRRCGRARRAVAAHALRRPSWAATCPSSAPRLMAVVLLVGRALDLDARPGEPARPGRARRCSSIARRPSATSASSSRSGPPSASLLLTPPLVAGLPRLPLGSERALARLVAAQAGAPAPARACTSTGSLPPRSC